jgi:hypothetical protein
MFTGLAADEAASPRPTTSIPEQARAAHELASPPQSAILGTGVVVEPVVPRRSGDDDLTPAIRSMVYLSLSYDRRIIDGARRRPLSRRDDNTTRILFRPWGIAVTIAAPPHVHRTIVRHTLPEKS